MCTVLPFSLSFSTIITVTAMRWRSSVERVKFIYTGTHTAYIFLCRCVCASVYILLHKYTRNDDEIRLFSALFWGNFVVFGEFFTMFSLKGGNFYWIRWIFHFLFVSRDFSHKISQFSPLKTQIFTFYASIFTSRSLLNRKSMTSGCSRVILSWLIERIN